MAEVGETPLVIRVAEHADDLELVAALRYRIYCEQLNLLRDRADHERRTLHLPNDEISRVLVAVRGDEAVGTLRIVPGPVARSEPDTVECFRLAEFDELLSPDQYVVSDRFMVDSELRSSNLARDLMMAATGEALGLGVMTGFACCEAHLVKLYTGFGFVPYTRLYNHPTSGVLVPLIFVGDPEHLTAIGSPLAGFVTDELRAPITMAQVRERFGETSATRNVDAATLEALGQVASRDDSIPAMLDGFSTSELDAVSSRGAEMHFNAGDALIRSGQTAQTLYVLLEGACEVVRDGAPVAVLTAGDVVGEMTFLLEERRSGDVIAVSDVRAVAFQASALRRLIDQTDPVAVKLLLNLARVLADRLSLVSSSGN